jgi:Flp pilus assembly protein TadG
MTDRTRIRPWERLRGLWPNAQGGVAVIFALSATALIAFLGAGLDMSRALVARQELSNVAAMACQYSTRPSVYEVAYSNNNGVQTYQTQVNTFVTHALANQNFTMTQTNGTPFTYTALGSTGQVSMTATVPMLFLPIVGINSLPVNVAITCATAQAQTQSPAGTVVLSESFENSACSGTCWSSFQPSGARNSFISTPVTTFPSNVGYVGSSGTEWTIMGYCLEVDAVGVIQSTVADGSHAAELDCDNGSGTAGASSISNKTYYTTGTYELRYSFYGRIVYDDYNPTYICGSTASDVSWANDTNASAGGANNVLRNNQVGVYFDPDQNGAAPTHVSGGGVTLAGTNLIDTCVTATGWIQRSVKITVTTAGYYWLSFAADGQNDSYGGDIDAVEVCVTSCSGSVQDNFPSTWTTSPLLFEDSFETPSTSGASINTGQTLDADYGASNNGWPYQTSFGWATGPYDQVGIVRASGMTYAGSQSLQLDSNKSGSQTTSQRSTSRYFYLDPGYYAISYDYISRINFSYSGYTGTYCTYTPSSSTALSSYSSNTILTGYDPITGSGKGLPKDTGAVAVFMSHSQEASYPVGGAGLNNTTSYYNPSGSTTTTPTVAPDSVSTSSYNPSQVNPVLDYCNYSQNWTTRTTYVKITKPGQYWLTIGAVGSSTSHYGYGGIVDDVKVSAVGSLYNSSPSFFAAIPTPTPAAGGTVSFTGFSIVADPLTP